MDIAAFIMFISIVGTVAGLLSSFADWRLESSLYGQPAPSKAVTLSVNTERQAVERFGVDMPATA